MLCLPGAVGRYGQPLTSLRRVQSVFEPEMSGKLAARKREINHQEASERLRDHHAVSLH
jgi:hypothetical protein